MVIFGQYAMTQIPISFDVFGVGSCKYHFRKALSIGIQLDF